MQLKTIFNKVERYKSFVVENTKWIPSEEDTQPPSIEIHMRARANGRPICSACGRSGSTYDHHGAPRRFEFVPLWAISVFLVYPMRRVNCQHCQKVKVERVPWAEGKSPLCTRFRWFLASWAKRISWMDVSVAFRVSWDKVYASVKFAVSWGLAHRDLTGVESIGVDEVQWHRGHHYQTVVYQLDEGRRRLLWIGADRTAKTLLRFFRWFGEERTQALKFVCSDMWRAYLKVIAKKAGHAIHVLDRFHVVQRLNKGVNEVRAAEAKTMKADGYEPLLKGSRWLLIKRPENLTEKQEAKLDDLLQYNLKSMRAYLLKEDFDGFWDYVKPGWAEKFLERWCTRAMRSKLDPMKKVARLLRKKKELLLNWFRAEGKLSAGITEGMNNKLKLITRKAYGFRTQEGYETALYHNLGDLPEQEFAHQLS